MSSSYRLAAVGAALVLVFAACDFLDWLFGTDATPPTCIVVSPEDSAMVTGVVRFRAEASDSWGIELVEFFVDGALLGSDSVSSYSIDWDTRNLADGSWHGLHCAATDPSGNVGYSDTNWVEVRRGGQRDVFHGTFRLPPDYYRWVEFGGDAGDTVSGDCRVVEGGTLGRLLLLDGDNYQEFKTGKSYTAIVEKRDFAETGLRAGLSIAGDYYLVFWNRTSPDTVEGWARFVLE